MRKIGLYRGCGVLWAVLLSMLLVSCATKIPVNLNTNLGYGISVDRVGYLSLSTSPVGFEPIGSHVDVSERVSLLIDIMDEITESEPYKQYHSSIRSITLDYDPDTEAVYLKNHWCIVVRPAENQGVERAEKEIGRAHV